MGEKATIRGLMEKAISVDKSLLALEDYTSHSLASVDIELPKLKYEGTKVF